MVNVNGRSIGGFMNGDFSQGSWPAFIALTTEPQNSPYGAFLIAQSDLQAQVSARESAIHADIQIGGGFMSWQSCKDIPGGTVDPNNADEVSQAEAMAGGDPSVKTKNNSNGTVTYETCTTQTPGSVIAGTLQKQMNVPADELELANDINSVFNALVTQMVSQVLNKGLGALSAGSGGQQSYTAQLQNNVDTIYSQQQAQNREQASAIIDQANGSLTQYKMYYDEAVSLVTTSKTNYQNALTCFQNKTAPTTFLDTQERNFAGGMMVSIQNILNNTVNPLLNSLTAKLNAANTQLSDLKNANVDSPSIVTTQQELYNQQAAYSSAVASASNANSSAQTNIAQAKKDFDDTMTRTNQLNASATKYQNACNIFPTIDYNAGF